jgi:hypothetical protein
VGKSEALPTIFPLARYQALLGNAYQPSSAWRIAELQVQKLLIASKQQGKWWATTTKNIISQMFS